MITGIETLSAIQPAIVTHSVIVAVPTSARPVYAPTTPPVPTNNAWQPAFSMIRACAAVGGCKTARTLSRRWISSCRRADFDRGFSLMVVRPFGRGIFGERLSQIIQILHLRIVEPRPSPSECETISFLGGSGGRERSVAWLDGPPGAAPYPIC